MKKTSVQIKLLNLFFLVFFSSTLFAQSFKQWSKLGDKAFEKGDYLSAQDYYKKALEINPIDKISYQLALTYYQSRDFQNSMILFKQISETQADIYPLSEFYLAMSYKSLGKYQHALQMFHKYYEKNRKNRDYYTLKTKQEIISTEQSFNMSLESDTSLLVTLLDTLSKPEHSELQWTSFDKNSSFLIAKRPINEFDSIYTSHLFMITDSIRLCDSTLNIPYWELGGVSYANNLKTLFFSACHYVDNKRICAIYSSKNDNKWSKPVRLDETVNFPNSDNIHPFFFTIKQHSFLLFASNVAGGEGGFDLYFSEYENGQFKNAKSLGRKINSIDNEICPSYDTLRKKMYFSSQWFDNFGGFDIFAAKGEFPQIDEPENLKSPVNSSYDDLYYSWDYQNERAVFSSNRLNPQTARTSTCCNDLFTFKLPQIARDTIIDTTLNVKRIEQMQALIPVDLYFDNDQPNPKCLDTTTTLSYEETYNTYFKQLELYENEFSKGLKKEAKANAIEMIDNFFFKKVEAEFDKLKQFNTLLAKLLEEGYRIEIVVKGFASPLNSQVYNTNLSKRRVVSIINYYRELDDGFFAQFMNNSNAAPLLSIKQESYGEDKASVKVSDDVLDVKNSVFSPWAAEERRVQIVAFKLEKNK